MLTNFLAALGLSRKLRSSRTQQTNVLSPEIMRTVMERERARADRQGGNFTVIVFTSRIPEYQERSHNILLDILRNRLRITDVAGYLDRDRLAALLPGTDANGAWRLADEISGRFPEEVGPPICLVYSHPFESLDDPQNGSSNGGNGVHTNHDRELAGLATDAERQHALPLQTLFARSMPSWKRGMDVMLSLGGLLALAPFLLLIAMFIRIFSPGPVFFRQWRMGRGGRPFLMLKFRTMVVDAEAQKLSLLAHNERSGPVFKIARDPRVTTFGRFLRSTNLDELPQLWNVLVGDMSLVGPRPLPCDEARACTSWQQRRLDVVPGLTCIWQVRKAERVSFDDWIRMDVAYIRNVSFWHDLKLLLQTLPVVLLGRGER